MRAHLRYFHLNLDDLPAENKASGCSEAVRLPKDVMREVRTMKAIFESFPVFVNKPENSGSEVECVLCSTTFIYPSNLETDFNESKMGKKVQKSEKKPP